MAQPTFHRSGRSVRRARLRRTLLIGALLAAGIAFAVGVLSGGEAEQRPIAKVAFDTSVRGEGSPRPAKGAPDAEAEAIAELFNDYYQRAFVDPASFSDGEFPEVAERFTADARSSFAADLDTLTIGEAATEASRVDPERATARIIVYFEGGEPTLATVAVRFIARATLKAKDADPLRIDQRGTYHLRKEGDAWRIAFYEKASQTQESFDPTASPSPTA